MAFAAHLTGKGVSAHRRGELGNVLVPADMRALCHADVDRSSADLVPEGEDQVPADIGAAAVPSAMRTDEDLTRHFRGAGGGKSSDGVFELWRSEDVRGECLIRRHQTVRRYQFARISFPRGIMRDDRPYPLQSQGFPNSISQGILHLDMTRPFFGFLRDVEDEETPGGRLNWRRGKREERRSVGFGFCRGQWVFDVWRCPSRERRDERSSPTGQRWAQT